MAFNLFKPKALPAIVDPDLLASKADQLISFMEMMGDPAFIARVESQLKNLVDSSSYFQAFQDSDDTGNYFGSEFNIRATAGRIKGTYIKEPWMYATATLIARTLSLVPYKVVDVATGQAIPNHPLNQKLTSGNKFQDGKTLNWCGYLDLILGGNFFRAFDEYYNDSMQIPVELVTLQIDNNLREITAINIWDNKQAAYGKTVPYKQVVHMKLPNPYNPFYGLSLFIAASRPLIMDRAMQEFQMAFYLRGATNSGVIETTEDINKTRMERLMRTFEAVYTGKRNWWRTIFLPKGAKWVKSGLSMAEMQHLEALKENRLTFLAAIGVPPSKVGIVQDVNRSTSEVQDETFWQNTIKPLAEFIGSSWNTSYLVRVIYGGRVRVEPDFSGIEALNGSLVSQGEQAKAVESHWKLDEIRAKIYKMPPMGDDRGNKLVAEIKPAGFTAPAALALPASTDGTAPALAEQNPVTDIVPDADMLSMKAGAVVSQERIEKKLGASYLSGYNKYQDQLFNLVEHALRNGNDLKEYLKDHEKELARTYITAVEDDLVRAMERGFIFANAQTKSMQALGKLKQKSTRFREIDQEAIDALRREQAPGKREILIKRAIENFVGFNETQTTAIEDIVADGLESGKSSDQIAADIRDQYDEQRGGQSNTIARTEILSAVSEGLKWNHDVLGEVFTEVQKQWYTVGDSGSNPHAREEHAEFEAEGPVESDYKWGNQLDYPRDPSADPSETINCRCTMVSVIPEEAKSNAEVILDNL